MIRTSASGRISLLLYLMTPHLAGLKRYTIHVKIYPNPLRGVKEKGKR